MSYKEFISWIKYANIRGNLNLGYRSERSLAYLMLRYANVNWKKTSGAQFELNDFVFWAPADTKETASPQQAFALLSTIAKSGNEASNQDGK